MNKRPQRGRGKTITQQTIAGAIRKFIIICPMLDFATHLDLGNKPRWCDNGKEFTTLDGLSWHIVRMNHISHGTLWHWYSRFKREGYSGLCGKPRGDKGTSRFFRKHPGSAAFVIRLSIRKGFSALAIHKELLQSCEDAPSLETTRAYVNSIRKCNKRIIRR